jgi:hypothetical protein
VKSDLTTIAGQEAILKSAYRDSRMLLNEMTDLPPSTIGDHGPALTPNHSVRRTARDVPASKVLWVVRPWLRLTVTFKVSFISLGPQKSRELKKSTFPYHSSRLLRERRYYFQQFEGSGYNGLQRYTFKVWLWIYPDSALSPCRSILGSKWTSKTETVLAQLEFTNSGTG